MESTKNYLRAMTRERASLYRCGEGYPQAREERLDQRASPQRSEGAIA
jgi:hypothetical protein